MFVIGLPESAERMQNAGMRQLSPREVRFQIKRALQEVPAATIALMSRNGRDKREQALDAIADAIAARFEQHDVYGPDPIGSHG